MFQWAVPFFPAQRLERQPTSCRRSILLQMVYRYQIGQQFVASGATSATSTACKSSSGFYAALEARAAFAEPSRDVYVAAKQFQTN